MLRGMKSELKGIEAVYNGLLPSSRKIMNSLIYTATPKASEKQMMKYASAHLREYDQVHLSSFLRFCTGSDAFTGKNITYNIIIHKDLWLSEETCCSHLELPVTYDSYPDFHHEMNSVLESNIWIMDIV